MEFRTRTRSVPITAPGFNGIHRNVSFKETITDETNAKGGARRTDFRHLSHTKEWRIFMSPYIPHNMNWVQPFPYGADDEGSFATPEITTSEVEAKVRATVMGLVYKLPDHSLINFFLELDETLSLFTKKLWQILTLRDKPNYLDWQFGIRPFIGDLKSMYGILADLHKRSLAYARLAGTTQPVFTSVRLQKNFFHHDPGFDFWGAWCQSYKSAEVKVALKVKGTIRYPSMSAFNTQLAAILDSFGIFLSPSTVWESIPFSWLIDWFVPVQNFLDFHTKGNFRPEINFSVVGWSRKIIWQNQIINIRLSSGAPCLVPFTTIRKGSSYERKPGGYVGKGFSLPELNFGQIAILVSLLV